MTYQPEPFVFVCCFCGEIYHREYTVYELGWNVDITPSCRLCRAAIDLKTRDEISQQIEDIRWESRYTDPSLREWLVGAELMKKEE
jgi:hypothetical protein